MKKLVCALDLGGTNLRAAVIDLKGEIYARARCSIRGHKNKQETLNSLFEMVEKACGKASISPSRLAGIAMAFPGPQDMEKGIVLESPNLKGWKRVPVGPIMEERFGRPWVLENDANAFGLGESWKGAGQGAKVLAGYSIGTGLGGFLISEGRLHYGHNFSGGELGHMILVPDGQLCGCGNRGCIESYVSATGITRRYNKKNTEAHEIFSRAKKGEKKAQKVVEETAHYLALGIVSLANMYNPDRFLIGGGVGLAGEQLISPVRKEVRQMSFASATRTMKIQRARLGDDANIYGAAWKWFNKEGLL